MERWPPSYDSAELAESIKLLRSHHQTNSFYELYQAEASHCQGDILQIESEIPIIDNNGAPAKILHDSSLWLIIGNTCDFARSAVDLRWTQLVPILNLGGEDNVDPELLGDLQNYRTSRNFYLPDWSGSEFQSHFMAEFVMPVTVDKHAIGNLRPIARLSRSAWILLNACLVRFLARDDGRFVN